MPRGVKGSGKGTAAKKEVQKVVAEKTRKPYPSIDERIALADQAIERLTKLNASRAELIAQTEAKLAERKATLAKSEAQLEKAKATRERLLAAKDKPAKAEKAQPGGAQGAPPWKGRPRRVRQRRPRRRVRGAHGRVGGERQNGR